MISSPSTQAFGIKWAHSQMLPVYSLSRIHNWVFMGKPWADWNVWLALDTYNILAEVFTWDTFTILIKQYYTLPTISNDNEKYDMWARLYSQTVNTNLCPYFEWWGWTLTNETKTSCALLPAWTQDPLARFAGMKILIPIHSYS